MAQRRLNYNEWEPVLVEEFDSYTSVADMLARSVWQAAPDEHPTLLGNQYEDQYYDSTAWSLRRGKLFLTAAPLTEPIEYRYRWKGRDTVKTLHYKSGWISLRRNYWDKLRLGDSSHWSGNRGVQYGMLEIRCRFAPGAGTWPAFWFYSGPTEIDVFEGGDDIHYSKREYASNVHRNSDNPDVYRASQKFFKHERTADLTQKFNTFTVVWTPTEVVFYLNRRKLRTVLPQEVPTFPYPGTIIANLAILSYSGHANWPMTNDGPRTSMAIDYIKVYKPRDGSWRYGRNVYATPSAQPPKRK